MRKPKIDRLSWRLGLSIAILVLAGQAAAFFLVYSHSSDQLLLNASEHARIETWLIKQALEHGMVTKDDRLLRRMVDGLARDLSFERIMILDREGQVRFSSDPAVREKHFSSKSPTCMVCHEAPAADRELSTVLRINGGSVIRAVQPILNEQACHSCHDPSRRINGLIIADVPMQEPMKAIERSAGFLAIGTSFIGLLLLGGITLVLRRLVMRRLFRFETAARALEHGDLGKRVPVEGDDALARVEDQFNRMADSLASALGELEQQRASLERVMNSVDDGMVVLDADRRVVAANHAFRKRFPVEGDEMVGLRCCVSSPEGLGCGDEGGCPAQQAFHTAKVQMAIRNRELDTGGVRQEEVRTSPVYSSDGVVSHVVEVWRDITDRRSAEAKLAEHERMVQLGRLASGFSHEVNTPLASIGTCIDGIARLSAPGEAVGEEERASIEDYARIAQTQVQRCGDITVQFLGLARGRSLSREVVDLRETATMTARLCKQVAAEAGVKVEVDEVADLPSVVANEAAVQQVLLNLVMNAIEASREGSVVRVSFRNGGDLAVIIADRGSGIAEADLPHIFEPFFTRRQNGTGLGLFVSLSLARSWDGDIICESEPGEGTRFTIVFPNEATDRPEGAAADREGHVET